MFTPRKSSNTVKKIFQPWSGSPQNSKFKIHPNSPEIPTYAIHTNRIFYEIYKDLHWRWNKERIPLDVQYLENLQTAKTFWRWILSVPKYCQKTHSRLPLLLRAEWWNVFRSQVIFRDEIVASLCLLQEVRSFSTRESYKSCLPARAMQIYSLPLTFRPTQQHINKNSTNHWKSFILKDYPACKFVINMIPYFLQ